VSPVVEYDRKKEVGGMRPKLFPRTREKKAVGWLPSVLSSEGPVPVIRFVFKRPRGGDTPKLRDKIFVGALVSDCAN